MASMTWCPRTVTMTGNVVLTQGKDVMRGTQLTVNLETGQATLGRRRQGTGHNQAAAACRASSRRQLRNAAAERQLGFLKHKQA